MSGHGRTTCLDVAAGDIADPGAMTELPPSNRLPDGTVTFLLTDVEASSRGWQADPAAMSAAMARHDEILVAAISTHGGMRPLEQGEGDSVVAVFARPSDGVRAALAAQRELLAERWTTADPLRVRMALHCGDSVRLDSGAYAGPTIIRTARLRDVAHGGQVVVSAAVRNVVGDDLPDGAALLDLGPHRLKDLALPEQVWQLTHPDLPIDFAPLRSLDRVPNNLPAALSTFVGRFDDIDTVVRLVLDNRFVTLTGPGGAGKTRLAQQVAAEVLDVFPDGVWWVDLGEVGDPDMVASAISRAARLPEDRADRVGGIGRQLQAARALLVLDNCEHLLDATAAVVARLLPVAPSVSVLATSRASLNVPGELSWRVPSLDVPGLDQVNEPVAALARFDAVRLFVDRARRVERTFELTERNAADVAEICARLDGIPLAVELAAARCRVLTPAEIRTGLTDALALLASGPRTVLPRLQTIDASIQWSHSLLGDDERAVLRRLAVFAGSFTAEAASALVGDPLSGSVAEVLHELAEQSLLQVDHQHRQTRFRMLETVRQFARRELDASGETSAATGRHAAHFAARARQLWPFFGVRMGELLEQADAEFADLATMLGHLERHASPEEHVAVAMACLPAMSVRHQAEAAALGDRAASRVDPTTHLGGRLHLQLAVVDPTMPRHVELGLAAAAATGDPDLTAHAEFWAAWTEAINDPTPDALARLRSTREGLARIGEDHFSLGHWIEVGLHRAVGRLADAQGAWERAAAETTCKRCSVMVWSEGALLALAAGDLDAARHACRRAVDVAVEVRDAGFRAHVRLTETELAARAGEPWPSEAIDAELRRAMAAGNPMAIGYLSEARGLGRLVDGALGEADPDLVVAIRQLDNAWPRRTVARLRRAAIAEARGDAAASAGLLDEMRSQASRWGAGPWLTSQIDRQAAALALADDDARGADELAHRALADAASGPWPPLVIDALEQIAAVAVARDSHLEAARLHGAAARLRQSTGGRAILAPDRARRDADLASARTALGDEAFEAAIAEGEALDLTGAVAYAQRARGERRRPSHGWDGLTPTEQQVADLALQGLANAEIASRLLMGRETVKTHLSSVYQKVGVANRTQLVADAARRGLTPEPT